jgi:DNA-binding response OmpR family regulator
MRLLLVDNDSEYLDKYLASLEKQYLVDVAYNAAEGAYLCEVNDYDVIVVDSALPDMSSPDLCRCTREVQATVPLMVLADQKNREDLIKSLEAGADVCVYKPIESTELTAQISALLRRVSANNKSELTLGNFYIDFLAKTVAVCGTPVVLRRKEYEVLEYLAINAGKIVSKENLLEHIWRDGVCVCSNILEVHVRNLRTKVEKPFGICLIRTVRGFGYKLVSGNM